MIHMISNKINKIHHTISDVDTRSRPCKISQSDIFNAGRDKYPDRVSVCVVTAISIDTHLLENVPQLLDNIGNE